MKNLQKKDIWVNWKFREVGGKLTKPPINPHTLQLAKTDDPTTWSAYQTALTNHVNKNLGKGIMLTGGLCGIDIDGGDNHTTPNPLEEEILALFSGTYAEKSPSGTGVHILFYCDTAQIPTVGGKLDPRFYQKNPSNSVECYLSNLTKRYFTVTGNQVSQSDEVTDQTEQVLFFLEHYMVKKTPPNTLVEDEVAIAPNIRNVILKSTKAEKFRLLYQFGDLSQHNEDHSKADLALCSLLAFFLEGDADAIDRAFRGSALYRPKWEREDYRTATVDKAIEGCGGKFYIPPGRPKKAQGEGTHRDKTPYLTPEALERYFLEKNIRVRRNDITEIIDIDGFLKENIEHLNTNLNALVYSELQHGFRNCSMATIKAYLDIVADRNNYNPVKELLCAHSYNGQDFLSELYIILGIEESDELSQTLIMKWLWQSLALLDNQIVDPFGADGILVLTGPQGIGKTSFLRKLAIRPQFFKEGKSINFRDKDSYIRCLSGWIAELGEIGSTLKRDVEELKAFVTAGVDEFRKPYGQSDIRKARRTSLCGSCNNADFLIDPTGNRRFWTVPVANIDLERLAEFDVIQLWKQIERLVDADLQGFRLTREEQSALVVRNGKHEKKLPGQEEIEDIFYKNQQGQFYLEPMTVSDFKGRYELLRNYSVSQIGKVLEHLGFKQETKGKDRLRYLPMPG